MAISSSSFFPNLYPYPIHLNVRNFVTVRLTSQNFLLWQTQIPSLISSQGLLGFINGESRAPKMWMNDYGEEVINPHYEAWLKTDTLVRSWIVGTLSLGMLKLAIVTDTSAHLWKELTTSFSSTSLWSLKKKKDTSLDEFVVKFNAICEGLAAIGKPVDDECKAYSFLTVSLLQSYQLHNKTAGNLDFLGRRSRGLSRGAGRSGSGFSSWLNVTEFHIMILLGMAVVMQTLNFTLHFLNK